MKRVIVVGGGIAGLAAAHRLTELAGANSLNLDIKLLEASSRLGGSIATERVGDFLVEAGPDSFITEKPWALRLCERLGLTSRLVSTQSAHQKIYIVHDGKLVELPEGFFLLAPTQVWPFIQTPLFSWAGKLRMAMELFLPRGEINEDESLGSFVRRRFGSEALERVAQPLVGGIYASDPDRIGSDFSTHPVSPDALSGRVGAIRTRALRVSGHTSSTMKTRMPRMEAMTARPPAATTQCAARSAIRRRAAMRAAPDAPGRSMPGASAVPGRVVSLTRSSPAPPGTGSGSAAGNRP